MLSQTLRLWCKTGRAANIGFREICNYAFTLILPFLHICLYDDLHCFVRLGLMLGDAKPTGQMQLCDFKSLVTNSNTRQAVAPARHAADADI